MFLNLCHIWFVVFLHFPVIQRPYTAVFVQRGTVPHSSNTLIRDESSVGRPYRTQKVSVGLGLFEERLVLGHGVLVHGLLCVCLVCQLQRQGRISQG